MPGMLAIHGGKKLCEKEFHRWPYWNEKDRDILNSVLERGSWGGYPSPNYFAQKFAQKFAEFQGAKYGVCCANGSVAIELAIWAANIPPGSEIIVPAYTFTATASSALFANCIPVFVDVCPETYCLDIEKVKAAINEKTRAIIPVHLACNMTDMDALSMLAAERNLTIIEDCAHAHGAQWNRKGAGSIGDMGTFSFQTSKLLTAGEGGIVITNDSELAMKLDSLVNCGRKDSKLHRFSGQMLGKNYRISEWSAGLLSTQLDRLTEQTDIREKNSFFLQELLSGFDGISFTKKHEQNNRRAVYQFILKYDKEKFNGLHRDRFLSALKAEGIPCEGDFYDPVYKGELFPKDKNTNPFCFAGWSENYDLSSVFCPVTEEAAFEKSIWLPHQLFLGDKEDIEYIAAGFNKIRKNLSELL